MFEDLELDLPKQTKSYANILLTSVISLDEHQIINGVNLWSKPTSRSEHLAGTFDDLISTTKGIYKYNPYHIIFALDDASFKDSYTSKIKIENLITSDDATLFAHDHALKSEIRGAYERLKKGFDFKDYTITYILYVILSLYSSSKEGKICECPMLFKNNIQVDSSYIKYDDSEICIIIQDDVLLVKSYLSHFYSITTPNFLSSLRVMYKMKLCLQAYVYEKDSKITRDEINVIWKLIKHGYYYYGMHFNQLFKKFEGALEAHCGKLQEFSLYMYVTSKQLTNCNIDYKKLNLELDALNFHRYAFFRKYPGSDACEEIINSFNKYYENVMNEIHCFFTTEEIQLLSQIFITPRSPKRCVFNRTWLKMDGYGFSSPALGHMQTYTKASRPNMVRGKFKILNDAKIRFNLFVKHFKKKGRYPQNVIKTGYRSKYLCRCITSNIGINEKHQFFNVMDILGVRTVSQGYNLNNISLTKMVTDKACAEYTSQSIDYFKRDKRVRSKDRRAIVKMLEKKIPSSVELCLGYSIAGPSINYEIVEKIRESKLNGFLKCNPESSWEFSELKGLKLESGFCNKENYESLNHFLIYGKEKERKMGSRPFAVSHILDKLSNNVKETNLKSQAMPIVCEESTMWMSSQQMKLHYNKFIYKKRVGSSTYVVKLDFESWNNLMKEGNTREVFNFLDDVFGFCGMLKRAYDKYRMKFKILGDSVYAVYYRNERGYRTDETTPLLLFGTSSGYDGWDQSAWTIHTNEVATIVKKEIQHCMEGIIQGDNSDSKIYVPNNLDFFGRTEYVNRKMKAVIDYYTKTGLITKLDETMVLHDYFSYSKETFINGVRCDLSLKYLGNLDIITNGMLKDITSTIGSIISLYQKSLNYTSDPTFTYLLCLLYAILSIRAYLDYDYSTGTSYNSDLINGESFRCRHLKDCEVFNLDGELDKMYDMILENGDNGHYRSNNRDFKHPMEDSEYDLMRFGKNKVIILLLAGTEFGGLPFKSIDEAIYGGCSTPICSKLENLRQLQDSNLTYIHNFMNLPIPISYPDIRPIIEDPDTLLLFTPKSLNMEVRSKALNFLIDKSSQHNPDISTFLGQAKDRADDLVILLSTMKPLSLKLCGEIFSCTPAREAERLASRFDGTSTILQLFYSSSNDSDKLWNERNSFFHQVEYRFSRKEVRYNIKCSTSFVRNLISICIKDLNIENEVFPSMHHFFTRKRVKDMKEYLLREGHSKVIVTIKTSPNNINVNFGMNTKKHELNKYKIVDSIVKTDILDVIRYINWAFDKRSSPNLYKLIRSIFYLMIDDSVNFEDQLTDVLSSGSFHHKNLAQTSKMSSSYILKESDIRYATVDYEDINRHIEKITKEYEELSDSDDYDDPSLSLNFAEIRFYCISMSIVTGLITCSTSTTDYYEVSCDHCAKLSSSNLKNEVSDVDKFTLPDRMIGLPLLDSKNFQLKKKHLFFEVDSETFFESNKHNQQSIVISIVDISITLGIRIEFSILKKISFNDILQVLTRISKKVLYYHLNNFDKAGIDAKKLKTNFSKSMFFCYKNDLMIGEMLHYCNEKRIFLSPYPIKPDEVIKKVFDQILIDSTCSYNKVQINLNKSSLITKYLFKDQILSSSLFNNKDFFKWIVAFNYDNPSNMMRYYNSLINRRKLLSEKDFEHMRPMLTISLVRATTTYVIKRMLSPKLLTNMRRKKGLIKTSTGLSPVQITSELLTASYLEYEVIVQNKERSHKTIEPSFEEEDVFRKFTSGIMDIFKPHAQSTSTFYKLIGIVKHIDEEVIIILGGGSGNDIHTLKEAHNVEKIFYSSLIQQSGVSLSSNLYTIPSMPMSNSIEKSDGSIVEVDYSKLSSYNSDIRNPRFMNDVESLINELKREGKKVLLYCDAESPYDHDSPTYLFVLRLASRTRTRTISKAYASGKYGPISLLSLVSTCFDEYTIILPLSSPYGSSEVYILSKPETSVDNKYIDLNENSIKSNEISSLLSERTSVKNIELVDRISKIVSKCFDEKSYIVRLNGLLSLLDIKSIYKVDENDFIRSLCSPIRRMRKYYSTIEYSFQSDSSSIRTKSCQLISSYCYSILALIFLFSDNVEFITGILIMIENIYLVKNLDDTTLKLVLNAEDTKSYDIVIALNKNYSPVKVQRIYYRIIGIMRLFSKKDAIKVQNSLNRFLPQGSITIELVRNLLLKTVGTGVNLDNLYIENDVLYNDQIQIQNDLDIDDDYIQDLLDDIEDDIYDEDDDFLDEFFEGR